MVDSYLHAKHMQSLRTIRSGMLACLRCGGSGIYHTFGKCFRCGGVGADPQQPQHPEKSKRLKQQREWAALFDEYGMPLPRVCPWCDHVIDHCIVRVCAKHQQERCIDELGRSA